MWSQKNLFPSLDKEGIGVVGRPTELVPTTPDPSSSEEGTYFHGGRSCRQRHPETMKIAARRSDVARASRPLSRGRPAPAGPRGQDAHATAGETPALRFSKQRRIPAFDGAIGAILGSMTQIPQPSLPKQMASHGMILMLVILGLATSFTLRMLADDEGDAWANKKSAWVTLTPAERGQVSDFAEDYKSYLNIARTAEGSTREMVRRAKAAGFFDFTSAAQVKPGARLIIP